VVVRLLVDEYDMSDGWSEGLVVCMLELGRKIVFKSLLDIGFGQGGKRRKRKGRRQLKIYRQRVLEMTIGDCECWQ
jgi:hypothetical protein